MNPFEDLTKGETVTVTMDAVVSYVGDDFLEFVDANNKFLAAYGPEQVDDANLVVQRRSVQIQVGDHVRQNATGLLWAVAEAGMFNLTDSQWVPVKGTLEWINSSRVRGAYVIEGKL